MRAPAWMVSAAPWVAMAAMGAAFLAQRAEKPQPGLSVQAVRTPEEYDLLEPGRGRLARTPREIPPLGWKDVLWRTYQEVTHDRLSSVAGSVTFYTLLAIFPALGVFVSLYGFVADVAAVQAQLASLDGVVPSEVLTIVGDQMMRLATQRPASLSAAFVVSLLLSVWSSNAAMKALFEGLNIAYDETEKRNYWRRSALTYAFTFGALLFLTTVTLILVAAPIAFRGVGLSRFALWWIPLRWLLLSAVATAVFSVVYRYGPCRARAKWRWVRWGAMFATGFWLVGSLGFSWYVNNIAHFDITYGSLGAVIGFMMWVWVSVMVVLIGAELNAEIEHQTAVDSTTGAPLPIGARGAAMADTVGLALRGNLLDAIGWAWRGGRKHAKRVYGYVRRKPDKPAAREAA